jgi:hypothetical protein
VGPSELRTFVGTGETVRDGVNQLPLLVLGSELVIPDNIVSVYACINWTEQGGTGDEAGDASASDRPLKASLAEDPLQGGGVEAGAG